MRFKKVKILLKTKQLGQKCQNHCGKPLEVLNYWGVPFRVQIDMENNTAAQQHKAAQQHSNTATQHTANTTQKATQQHTARK
jgi:hypothetical protein